MIPIVPMFHANAWGVPYAAFLAGAELLLVGQHLKSGPLLEFIAAERPTVTGAVPTILNDLLAVADRDGYDLSCSGWSSAVARRCPGRLWSGSANGTACG